MKDKGRMIPPINGHVKCSDCKFFVKAGEAAKTEDQRGQCRRFPPNVVYGLGPMATFPLVLASEWCGEFVLRNGIH